MQTNLYPAVLIESHANLSRPVSIDMSLLGELRDHNETEYMKNINHNMVWLSKWLTENQNFIRNLSKSVLILTLQKYHSLGSRHCAKINQCKQNESEQQQYECKIKPILSRKLDTLDMGPTQGWGGGVGGG